MRIEFNGPNKTLEPQGLRSGETEECLCSNQFLIRTPKDQSNELQQSPSQSMMNGTRCGMKFHKSKKVNLKCRVVIGSGGFMMSFRPIRFVIEGLPQSVELIRFSAFVILTTESYLTRILMIVMCKVPVACLFHSGTSARLPANPAASYQ